jgi:hypothetical protein
LLGDLDGRPSVHEDRAKRFVSPLKSLLGFEEVLTTAGILHGWTPLPVDYFSGQMASKTYGDAQGRERGWRDVWGGKTPEKTRETTPK